MNMRHAANRRGTRTRPERQLRMLAVAAAATALLLLPGSALAAEMLTATPTVTGKLGAGGTLTVSATVTDSLGGVPSPLDQLTIDVPPGVTYNWSSTPVCPLSVVQAASGSVPPTTCPTGSKIGTGSATIQAVLGTSLLVEPAVIDRPVPGQPQPSDLRGVG